MQSIPNSPSGVCSQYRVTPSEGGICPVLSSCITNMKEQTTKQQAEGCIRLYNSFFLQTRCIRLRVFLLEMGHVQRSQDVA